MSDQINRTIIKTVIIKDPIRKIPLGRAHLRWENCIKTDVKFNIF